jgi:outer membrane protein TolC
MIKYLIVFNIFVCLTCEAKVYQLKELIALTKVHPEIKIEQFEVDKARSLFDRIDGETTRPKITILGGLGPNKSTKGDALSSYRSDNIDTVSYLANIDLKIPIFMFNRQGDLNRAAEGNVKVKEIEVQRKQADLIKKVKEYYYGFEYASSLNDFAISTLKDLDDVLGDMKEKKTKNEELTKIELFRSLAQVKKFEIEKGLSQSILGLKYITQDDDPKIEQDWIEYSQRELPTLEQLNSQLALTNFDLRKANIGVDAKQAWLTSEKKSQLPVFGIFSSFNYLNTAKSTKQSSKFAYDPYNKADFSVGIGFIWDIDFGVKASNVSTAQIELETVRVQQAFAQKNLPIKIEKIYLDLIEAQKKATELEKSYKTSKKLLNNVASGVALGIAPAKDIIESYTMKAAIYQQYVEAIYNYEMRLSDLSYEMGKELDPTLI